MPKQKKATPDQEAASGARAVLNAVIRFSESFKRGPASTRGAGPNMLDVGWRWNPIPEGMKESQPDLVIRFIFNRNDPKGNLRIEAHYGPFITEYESKKQIVKDTLELLSIEGDLLGAQ